MHAHQHAAHLRLHRDGLGGLDEAVRVHDVRRGAEFGGGDGHGYGGLCRRGGRGAGGCNNNYNGNRNGNSLPRITRIQRIDWRG